MGCNNEADTETLETARSANDAVSPLPDPSGLEAIAARAAQAVEAVDRTGDTAILRARSGAGRPTPAERAAYGDVAESAVARAVLERHGHQIVHLNTRKGEQGVDIVSFDEETGSLTVWEVKSSLVEGAIGRSPRLGTTRDGRQMGATWLNNGRLAAAGLDVADAGDVEARAVQIDLVSGQARIWTVDPASGDKVDRGEPFDIEDLLDLQG